MTYNFSEALELMKQGHNMTIFEHEYPFYFSYTKEDTYNKPAFWNHHIYTDEKSIKLDFHHHEILSENWIIYKGKRKY